MTKAQIQDEIANLGIRLREILALPPVEFLNGEVTDESKHIHERLLELVKMYINDDYEDD